jgi:hypothetical protein
MKYKLFALGLFVSLCLAGNAFGQAAQSPEQAATAFYKWYLRELNGERYPIQRQKSEILKKVSKRLGKWLYSPEYEDFGADYFLSAQDWDENWAKSVTASKAVITGNNATLRLTLGAAKSSNPGFGRHTLAIKLIKEGNTWKIDRVNNN